MRLDTGDLSWMVVKIGNVDESYRSYDIIRIWIELIKYYSITHF